MSPRSLCSWLRLGLRWCCVEAPGDPGTLEGLDGAMFLPKVPPGGPLVLVQGGAGIFARNLGSLEC